MFPWIRNLATGAAARVPTLLTLTALGALAFWGRSNDWRLSPSGPGDQRTVKQAPAGPAVNVRAASPGSGSGSNGPSASGPVRIEFPSAAAADRVGIRVAPVRVRTLTHTVTAPGMLDYEAGRYARLTARASGSVLRVDKEIGDPVRKGELLALLDSAEVGRLKADFLRDVVQVKWRSATLERLREGYRKGAVPEATLRQTQTKLREDRIRLVNDQQALLNLGLPVRLEELEKLPDDRLARRLRLLGLPQAVARQLDPETLTANLLPLTAPFDGQVVERNVAAGEVVQTAQPKPLFVVGDVRRLDLDLDVNPEDMAGVRVGQPVTFRPNDGGPEAAGRVSHISPEVNGKTRRVQVHAEVPNKDRRLRPNTFGTGQIVVAQRPRAVVVPGEAVQSAGHARLVFVRISATRFEARPVRPGLRQGDLVEVSGVREGEEVVTTGSFLLNSELQKDRIAGGDD
jgi:cobalt-zinc-cadmium efflux system membrane fusion protein